MNGQIASENGTSPTRSSFVLNGADGFDDSRNGKLSGEDVNLIQSNGRFPRISRPVELMRPSYDVVVIGSGYGGGVAASRMARGRQSVCVLERGKERWPGEFPEKIQDALKELHISGEFAPGDRRSLPGHLVDSGDPNGLYHLVVGEGQNVFMGNGLGGTSLLNANVFLKAHPKVLDMEIWPQELRRNNAWRKCE
jgi:choline dehydrogenase-like flavoprotein